MSGRQGKPADSIGDILRSIVRKDALGKHQVTKRAQAQKLIAARFVQLASHLSVKSVKAGVALIEVDSAPLFAEMEGFRREELLAALKEGGMEVHEVRLSLGR